MQFKETGIRLTVTPHVTNNRQILMTARTPSARRSSRWPRPTSASSSQKQKADNQLLVNDGETAVIGGLTVTEVEQDPDAASRCCRACRSSASCSASANDRESRRDLIILVTPRITDDGD